MSELISHEQVLLNAVEAANENGLPENGLVVKSHGPNTNETEPGEYSATLKGVNNIVEGEVEVTYDRLNVATVLEAAGMNLIAVSGRQVSTTALANAIREQLQINITAQDLPDNVYGPFETPTIVDIEIVQDSLLFRGSLPVMFYSNVESDDVSLLNSGRVPFVPEVESPEVIYTQAKSLSGNEITGNNRMIHATGNPITNFVNASTDEISLSVAGRIWKNSNTFPAGENNTFLITVPNNGDWNLPFSFALKNSPEGKKITDLYDIGFSWIKRDSYEGIEWALREVDGQIIFVNTDGTTGNIVDNTVSQDGKVVQNIQRMQHYAKGTDNNVFTVTQANPSGSLLGDFTFRVRAKRKDSVFDVINLEVNVTAVAPEVAPE